MDGGFLNLDCDTASPLIGTHQDDTFSTSAQLGSELSTIVVGAIE